MELSTLSTDSASSVDGIRLADLAEELPIGRSSLFELLKALSVTTAKGPGPDGRGRVAWVSSADADRLRTAAHSVNKGEARIADFSAALTPRKDAFRRSPAASADAPDSSPFLARLEAAERAVGSGLGLTTAETAWILGVLPGSSPVTRGGITATRTSKNCWRLTKAT
jgi:hypothetical protein